MFSFSNNSPLPQTPERRRQKLSVRDTSVEGPSAGLSPALSSKSSADSGVDDLFDSPLKMKTPKGAPSVSRDSESESEVEENESDKTINQDGLESTQDSLAEEKPTRKLMPEDPFETEQSKILFEAIDQLLTCGSHEFLSVPQLIIVGGQSTGKSSLLQSLTKIPFPVGTGCCTRFPTRIVSRRTPPGNDDSFRISIERAEERLDGMRPASDKVKHYEYKGDTLSTEDFVRVMEEISSEYMGIRRAKGADKKNFAADVLKIELSGPNRSYFSILDLPGIFHNASEVNVSDIIGVKNMITKYMKKPENIVICVADALTDLDNHEILKLAADHVEKKRLVGVFTKCDMVKPGSSLAKKIVSIASGPVGRNMMPKGWFLVRNRTEEDLDSMEIQDAEDRLFRDAPWASVPKEQLGSVALKNHLGVILSSKIRDSFPSIQEDIKDKLEASLAESVKLGSPRDNHSARLQYLTGLIRQYEEKAKTSLWSPGLSDSPAMELRREVSRLNREFDRFMRAKGGFWEFEENESDPRVALELLKPQSEEVVETIKDKNKAETTSNPVGNTPLSPAFAKFSQVGHSTNLFQEIRQALEDFDGAQLPGVTNPEIYPLIYRRQVKKWTAITETHLQRVWAAVNACLEAILKSVCPPTGATANLHQRLMKIITLRFKQSYEAVKARCLTECERETKCKMPQTTDPSFEQELSAWRRLRFWRGLLQANNSGRGLTLDDIKFYYECLHLTAQENMVKDVHDVVRVYYKVSLKAFIHDITTKYIEDFVCDAEGPLLGLNSNYIMKLWPEEVESLACEDDLTLKRRQELAEEIEKYEVAYDIAERARQRTAELGLA